MYRYLPILVCLTACQTPYQADGWFKRGGYSETPIGPDSWRVEFRGNENTELERAKDFSLLRAAELCSTSSTRFVIVEDTELLMEQYEEEEVEEVHDDEGNVVEEYTRTYLVTYPRVIRDIRCADQAPIGVEHFDPTFLQHSIKKKYQI